MTLEELSKDEQRQADEQNEMTYKAAVIEANRLKSKERMDIDRERLNAAIDKLIEAARFRIKRKPKKVLLHNPRKGCFEYGQVCDRCTREVIQMTDNYCPSCGQALGWSEHE